MSRNCTHATGSNSLLLFLRLLLGGSDLCLLLCDALGKESIILYLLLLLHLNLPAFERAKVSAALKTDRSYQALDFRTNDN